MGPYCRTGLSVHRLNATKIAFLFLSAAYVLKETHCECKGDDVAWVTAAVAIERIVDQRASSIDPISTLIQVQTFWFP